MPGSFRPDVTLPALWTDSPNWLTHLLDNPPRLLEPAVRRHARAAIGATPSLDLDRIFSMLTASKPRTRLTAAELLLDACLLPLVRQATIPGASADQV